MLNKFMHVQKSKVPATKEKPKKKNVTPAFKSLLDFDPMKPPEEMTSEELTAAIRYFLDLSEAKVDAAKRQENQLRLKGNKFLHVERR